MPGVPLTASLYPFQAKGVALCALRPRNLAIWSTGIGKTLLAIGTAALLVSEGMVDGVLVAAEKSKVADWERDFARFTDGSMPSVVYAGTPKQRERLRSGLDQYAVVVGSYDTLRRDLVAPKPGRKGRSKAIVDGPLTEALAGRRMLVVLDEVSAKCANRQSQTHKAVAHFVNGRSGVRVLGLTATPLTRNPESIWNVASLIDRDTAGTVGQFQKDHISGFDLWGNPSGWKNLEPPCETEVVSLKEKLAPIITVKSKFDSDVIDQFPRMVEEPEWVLPSDAERALLRMVAMTSEDESGLMTLRQCAAHPRSLLLSQSALAQQVVSDFGAERIAAVESTKEDRLVEMLLSLKEQDAQAVVFTFFGQTVLKLLSERMTTEGITHVVHHGQLSGAEREKVKGKFTSGNAQVFLSSDAGARGLNLPQATHVIQYEPPLTWADYEQRTNRHHRIDSKHPSVTAVTMIARSTVEEGIVGLVLARNRWTEAIAGVGEADGELTAEQRRELLRQSRRK
jgi:SNF2 family DNA or RNA helicase